MKLVTKSLIVTILEVIQGALMAIFPYFQMDAFSKKNTNYLERMPMRGNINDQSLALTYLQFLTKDTTDFETLSQKPLVNKFNW